MNEMAILKMDLKSELAEIARFTHALSDFSTFHGLSEKEIFQSTLVMDELLTNVISYSEAQHIHVEAAYKDKGLTLKIEDDGNAYNPLEETVMPDLDAPLEERKIGGLGVHITKKMMDDVHYEYKDGLNILTLVKKIGAA